MSDTVENTNAPTPVTEFGYKFLDAVRHLSQYGIVTVGATAAHMGKAVHLTRFAIKKLVADGLIETFEGNDYPSMVVALLSGADNVEISEVSVKKPRIPRDPSVERLPATSPNTRYRYSEAVGAKLPTEGSQPFLLTSACQTLTMERGSFTVSELVALVEGKLATRQTTEQVVKHYIPEFRKNGLLELVELVELVDQSDENSDEAVEVGEAA